MQQKIHAAITGVAGYVPEYVLTNDELEKLVDTNDEWKARRNKFRHPFSISSLQKFEGEVEGLVDKLCAKVSSASCSGTVIEIDKLLGQMAMDAICSVAFSYKLCALDDSEEFRLIHENLTSVLEV
jgi:cytochrome P450